MQDIIFVTGGARSGKSSFAEGIASGYSERVLYLATAVGFDEEMKERIRNHRNARPVTWKTVERFEALGDMAEEPDFKESDVILLDCLSLMLNNRMHYAGIDFGSRDFESFIGFEQEVLGDLGQLAALAERTNKRLIIVSNEIGMGLVPADPVSRQYRDMLGRLNRFAAKMAHEAYFLVSGMPIKIK